MAGISAMMGKGGRKLGHQYVLTAGLWATSVSLSFLTCTAEIIMSATLVFREA